MVILCDNGFTFRNSLFVAAKLTKILHTDKYSYSGYVVLFDLRGKIRFPILMLCPISLSPSSLESGGKGEGIFVTLPERILQNGLEILSEI